jgi:hypothetical protein
MLAVMTTTLAPRIRLILDMDSAPTLQLVTITTCALTIFVFHQMTRALTLAETHSSLAQMMSLF